MHRNSIFNNFNIIQKVFPGLDQGSKPEWTVTVDIDEETGVVSERKERAYTVNENGRCIERKIAQFANLQEYEEEKQKKTIIKTAKTVTKKLSELEDDAQEIFDSFHAYFPEVSNIYTTFNWQFFITDAIVRIKPNQLQAIINIMNQNGIEYDWNKLIRTNGGGRFADGQSPMAMFLAQALSYVARYSSPLIRSATPDEIFAALTKLFNLLCDQGAQFTDRDDILIIQDLNREIHTPRNYSEDAVQLQFYRENQAAIYQRIEKHAYKKLLADETGEEKTHARRCAIM